MWTAWLLLTLNGLFFTLRLAGNTGSFPRALSREEEQDCLERMAQGDTDARDELIEHNLRLVAHIVKKYYTPNGDQDDLISIGTIGLIKGVSTFRPDKNVRLATYASRCIENAILSQCHALAFRAQKKHHSEVSAGRLQRLSLCGAWTADPESAGEHGASRKEFAAKFGVWTATVQDWETDSVRMTRQTWEKLFR